MSSPLAALCRAYEIQLERTMALPHLGMPGVDRRMFTGLDDIPALPDVEFSAKTKDPTIMCIEHLVEGRTRIRPVLAGCSGRAGREMTAELVRKGVHPLDIIVATWDSDTDDFTFRTAVQHLLWTADDQKRLEGELAAELA